MNKCELAKHFDVSRATVLDWERRGAPIGKNGGDPAEVAGWKARRDLARTKGGSDLAFRDLPNLMAELTRRQLNLEKRIQKANAMPPNMKAEPGAIKGALCAFLAREQALLELPARIISDHDPSTLPARLIRAVLGVLDEGRTACDDGEDLHSRKIQSAEPARKEK